jgi:hypothetical protein
MKPLLILLLPMFLMGCGYASAQNLSRALYLNYPIVFRGEKIVLEVAETHQSIQDKTAPKTKVLQRFDAMQKLILQETFKGEMRLSKDTITYHSPGGVKKASILETWDANGSYQRRTENYIYDTRGFLVRIREFSEKGYLRYETRIKNQGRGLPYLLDKFDGNDNPQGSSEEAEYLPEINRYIAKKTNAMGKESSRDTLVLDPLKVTEVSAPGEMYNKQGELIKDPYHAYEYRYDEQGNWIEKKCFEVKMINGKEKRTLLEKSERKYVYLVKK